MIPVCIGMPRSASRMTWQVTKLLLPPEPDWWQGVRQRMVTSGFTNEVPWPHRSHGYIDGNDPVIYTYRHPIEAYLSFLSRVGLPLEKDALNGIVTHTNIVDKLAKDEEAGRRVLWLRYEDYYDNEAKRIQDICDYLGLEGMPVEQIATDVSLQKNLERSYSMGPGKTFTNHTDDKHGLQPGHVNKKTMGMPGAYLRAYKNILELNAHKPGMKSLIQLSRRLGY